MAIKPLRWLLAIGIALGSLGVGRARAETLAYWRFEDHAAGEKLDAATGTSVPPYSTTADSSGHGNALRTFNTRPALYPPDTSGTFVSDPSLPQVGEEGRANARCVRFVGHEDFYTAAAGASPAPVESARLGQFMIEGLFKLDTLSERIGDKYQVILAKDGRPVRNIGYQPFAVVVGGKDDQYLSRDCLSANMIDSSGHYRTAPSRTPLKVGQWYAFAVVCDGRSLKLFLNRFEGRGYELEGQTAVNGGLIESKGQWTVGRGNFWGEPNSWLFGSVDELRISDEALEPSGWLTARLRALPAPATRPVEMVVRPQLCARDLADPTAIYYQGVYYLYGTDNARGFGVWSSRDLAHWEKGPRVIQAGPGVWGDSAFWAPGVIERKGTFYMYYSASGIMPDSGGRRSVRMNVAVSNSPMGPFKEVVSRMPLLGRAVIDPTPFIDEEGRAYLYFVADISENNGSGQIYGVRLSDDLLSPVGEPVPCLAPSQAWEGPKWNEGPFVFRVGKWYVMTYSGEFFASPNYAVGAATSLSPFGPWDKRDDNPFLYRYGGLRGTGHNSLVRTPDGKGWLIFFHAHRSETDATRDTYFAKLEIDRDSRGEVKLKVVPWRGEGEMSGEAQSRGGIGEKVGKNPLPCPLAGSRLIRSLLPAYREREEEAYVEAGR